MRNLLLAVILGATMLPGSLLAQAEENDSISPRLREQQEKYERGEGLYPAKKRSKLALIGQLGYSAVYGDVNALPGYTGALAVEKALGHVVSLRAMGAYSFTKGLNTGLSKGYAGPMPSQSQIDRGTAVDPFLNSKPGGSYYNAQTGVVKGVYYNHATQIYDLNLQAIFHLGNINFYKESNKWDFYAGVGPGIMGYNTMVDAKKRVGNAYQLYDFEKLSTQAEKDFAANTKKYASSPFAAWNRNAHLRKLINTELKSEDKGNKYNYESNAGTDAALTARIGNGFPFSKNTSLNTWGILPTVNLSLGTRFKLNDRLELGLEQRIIYSNTDLLDGKAKQEKYGNPGSLPTTSKDLLGNTTVNLGLRLGKNATDALWWINPMNTQASSASDGRRMMKNLGEDADADGVADLFDKDPNTPEGAIVDGSGRTLDLDQDGVADGQDAQPYTPKGCPVDSKGVAKDDDNDGVPNCLDKEAGTATGTLVDNNGKAIVMPKMDCAACADLFKKDNPTPTPNPTPNPAPNPVVIPECNLPSVHFDAGGSVIKQEFYPDLYYVAKYMMDHPGTSIRVVGNDDKSETVARRRAEAAINFIVGNFAVDRNRFSISTTGGVRVGNGNSYKNPKSGPLDYLNRRVDFECN